MRTEIASFSYALRSQPLKSAPNPRHLSLINSCAAALLPVISRAEYRNASYCAPSTLAFCDVIFHLRFKDVFKLVALTEDFFFSFLKLDSTLTASRRSAKGFLDQQKEDSFTSEMRRPRSKGSSIPETRLKFENKCRLA